EHVICNLGVVGSNPTRGSPPRQYPKGMLPFSFFHFSSLSTRHYTSHPPPGLYHYTSLAILSPLRAAVPSSLSKKAKNQASITNM
ncbi:hypothetical protein, partial [Segatella buccae]